MPLLLLGKTVATCNSLTRVSWLTVLQSTEPERHLSYGITECHLPPDTGKRAVPQPLPDRLIGLLDLATCPAGMEG